MVVRVAALAPRVVTRFGEHGLSASSLSQLWLDRTPMHKLVFQKEINIASDLQNDASFLCVCRNETGLKWVGGMAGSCFVMMPFTPLFEGYHKAIFAPVLRKLGLVPVKVNEIYTPTQISFDIFEQISKSRLVLADVTGKNANVNYELGIAHALSKDTVILTQNAEDIPFDYRHLRYIIYDTREAGWERRLSSEINRCILSILDMNYPTSNLAGQELKGVIDFLTNSALDSSYVVDKTSKIVSDNFGSCNITQDWTITAKSEVTHILYGMVSDSPGSIHLTKAYDKTNGVDLRTLISVADERRARYIILLSKKILPGESVIFELQIEVEGFLHNLFSRDVEIIFQRPNTRRDVFYKSRVDIYMLPISDKSRGLSIHNLQASEFKEAEIIAGKDFIEAKITLKWDQPYNGGYSYEMRL